MFLLERPRLQTQILAVLSIFLPPLTPINAQVKTAHIVGVATDGSGAAIPDAKVTAVDLGTNHARFKTEIISGVALSVGDRLKLDVSLATGGTPETVTVSAEEVGLQTQPSDLQSKIDQRAVQDLLVNNRNFATLAQLAAGAKNLTQGYAVGNAPDDRRPTSTVQANGQSPRYNNLQIDGMNNNNERFVGTTNVKPSVEAIQEVQMATGLYPVGPGRTSAAVINLITKSGTNQFHGSVYEYFRNDIFDTSNVLTSKVSPYKQNQFGRSVSGPITKNRTFFFGDYEGPDIQRLVHLASVPTLLILT